VDGFSAIPTSVRYRLSRSAVYVSREYVDLNDSTFRIARFARLHTKSIQASASFPPIVKSGKLNLEYFYKPFCLAEKTFRV
jgi:hypothetical protein